MNKFKEGRFKHTIISMEKKQGHDNSYRETLVMDLETDVNKHRLLIRTHGGWKESLIYH